ncbi:MAG TPA: hypothetical protein VJJ80_00475 [Patescibacteria group bacterium]|nr:hypothetical protein [Patescibacteria group bacterium]
MIKKIDSQFSKKIIAIIFGTLFSIFLLIISLGFLFNNDYLQFNQINGFSRSVERKKPALGEIRGLNTFGQTFHADNNNLAQISVLFATYPRLNNQEIIFHLRESTSSKIDLRSGNFNAQNIHDMAFINFRFKPILDSANKDYYFYLESPTSFPGNAVSTLKLDANYENGNLILKGKKTNLDMVFKIYYKENYGQFTNTLLNRFSQLKPFFFKKISWLILLPLYFLATLAFIFALTWKFARQQKNWFQALIKLSTILVIMISAAFLVYYNIELMNLRVVNLH